MFNIPTQRLAKVTVTETTSAVTLSVNPIVIAALSFTPRHLVVRVNGSGSVAVNALLRLNGDTGANYNQQRLSGIGSSTSASRTSSSNETVVAQFGATLASVEILLPDALSTRSHKSGLSFPGDSEDRVDSYAFRWASTAAITSVTIFGVGANFTAGSTFELCVVDESFNIDQDGDGEQILGSNGTFSVGSIGAADGDLVVIGNLRDAASAYAQVATYQLNSDSTATNYNVQKIEGTGTAPGATAENNNKFATVAANTATTSAFSPTVTQVTNFSDGSNDRVTTTLYGYNASATAAENSVGIRTSRWNNTAAITSYALPLTYLTGSMLSTYAVPKNLITRTELASAAGSVTFSSIPQTYDHLELSIYARSDRAAGYESTLAMQFNGDTTVTNYDYQRLAGDATTVAATQSTGDDRIGNYPGASETANQFGATTVTIYNYTKTDRHKHHMVVNGFAADNSETMSIMSKRWENTAAITSIVIDDRNGDDLVAGSVFTLRGINSTVAAATSDVAALNGIAPADIEAVN